MNSSVCTINVFKELNNVIEGFFEIFYINLTSNHLIKNLEEIQ